MTRCAQQAESVHDLLVARQRGIGANAIMHAAALSHIPVWFSVLSTPEGSSTKGSR
jgi:hypothetical protein